MSEKVNLKKVDKRPRIERILLPRDVALTDKDKEHCIAHWLARRDGIVSHTLTFEQSSARNQRLHQEAAEILVRFAEDPEATLAELLEPQQLAPIVHIDQTPVREEDPQPLAM